MYYYHYLEEDNTFVFGGDGKGSSNHGKVL